MNILIQIAIKIILMILIAKLTKTTKPPAGTMADTTVPDVSESKSIPFGYGTYKTAGNVLWYDDFGTRPIVEGGGLFAPDITVGYKYYLGIHNGVVFGYADLQSLLMNDTSVWTNTGQSGSFESSYDAPNLISDDNGVSGVFRWYDGYTDQVIDPYLDAWIDAPKFTGLAHIVFEKNYIGNSTTPPTASFVLSSKRDALIFDQNVVIIDKLDEYTEASLSSNLTLDTPFNSAKSVIITNEDESITYLLNENYTINTVDDKIYITDQSGATNPIAQDQYIKVVYHTRYYDLNPAVMIYDILVNDTYGANVLPSRIDEQSFIDAAQTLYDENFGLSLVYDSSYSAEDFILEILRHISAVKVDDFYTGLTKIKLIRNDYDESTLSVFDESNIVSMNSYERTGSDDLYSELKVEYINKQNNFKSGIEIFQNEGLRTERANATQSVTQTFNFCTTSKIAAQIAYREAIPVSTALAKYQFTCQKELGLELGDVIKVSWEDYEIEEMVLRIQSVDYGTFANNIMTITAIQDTFGIQFTSYNKPGRNKFKETDFTALPSNITAFDTNYFLSGDQGKVIVAADKPSSTHVKYNLKLFDTVVDKGKPFTPIAEIDDSINEDNTEINIITEDFIFLEDQTDINLLQGYNLAIITDGTDIEYINFKTKSSSINKDTINEVKRGCCDSKPRKWIAGSKIFFISYGNSISPVSTINFNQLSAQTITPKDTLYNAPSIGFVTKNRVELPILPCRMSVNNNIVYDEINIGLNELMELSWGYRKIESQNIVRSFLEIGEDTIDNTVYRIVILDKNGVTLIDTTTTTEGYIFNEVLGSYEDELNVYVYSQLNGLNSHEFYNFTVYRV